MPGKGPPPRPTQQPARKAAQPGHQRRKCRVHNPERANQRQAQAVRKGAKKHFGQQLANRVEEKPPTRKITQNTTGREPKRWCSAITARLTATKFATVFPTRIVPRNTSRLSR